MFDVDLELLINKEAQAFYQQNQLESLDKLLFRYAKDPISHARAIQLEAKRRAHKKLPEWYSNPEIVFPPKTYLEQASSQETAAYKANLVDFKTSIDLTGGTGIDSWQFALKSQNHVFVEPNADLVRLASHNFHALKLSNTQLVNTTAESYLETLSHKHDLIYLDPLRRVGGTRKVLLDDYSPNVIALQNKLLEKATHVFIKVSPLADLTYLLNSFQPHVKAIHVVAVKNECKEVLVHLTKEISTKSNIITVNIAGNKKAYFEFMRDDETKSAKLTNSLDMYLFEPNAAVLKAGAFNSIATQFNLHKLHVNSHLYTSNNMPSGFPGNAYKVIEQSAPYKLKRVYEGVSIATRNFPQPVKIIRKKTRFTDGQKFKLFATTLGTKKAFIVCQKVEG